MKRAVFVLGLAAFVVMPVAAQWTGMPVWNSPKAGTGVTFSGDWGKPDSSAGKGNAFGARASLGIGTITLTAGVASYKPENFNASTTAVGGQAAFRVIGGSLLPIAVNLQFGAGVSAKATSGLVTIPKITNVIGAVGFSIPLPTPGFSLEPYFSPGIRYRKVDTGTASASQTKFGFALGANIGMGLFGLHLAYDYQKLDTGHAGTFGLGAHVSLKVPLGM
jgi:predicted porin